MLGKVKIYGKKMAKDKNNMKNSPTVKCPNHGKVILEKASSKEILITIDADGKLNFEDAEPSGGKVTDEKLSQLIDAIMKEV